VLERPQWRTDPRFRTARDRVIHRQALARGIEQALSGRTRAEWELAFRAAGVPVGPVQSVAEALSHPQARAVGMVVDAATAAGGTRPMIGSPLHLGGQSRPAVTAAPHLGQHTVEVLAECGFGAGEIQALLDAGGLHQWDGAAVLATPAEEASA
jgi:crotonobetainyl-CoA:carnitine CoA-transferase CaiB-like acyl-CoA transferase